MAETVPALSIPPDKVCFVVMKAREFEVEDLPAVSDNGSNPADDREPAMLEDRGDDPVVQELAGFVSAMSVDERIDLVALAWLGRGDGGLNEWGELRAEAARLHTQRTAHYLLGLPLLPEFLEEALAQLGLSCAEFERDHL